MANYLEYDNRAALHPGYYVREWMEYNGYSEKEFAIRLGTDVKKLKRLVSGKDSINAEMAVRLSGITGSSVQYWLNTQTYYDTLRGKKICDMEFKREKAVFRRLGWKWICNLFGVDITLQSDEDRVDAVRNILDISSLTILEYYPAPLGKKYVRDYALLLLGINEARKTDCPAFNIARFRTAVELAKLKATDYDGFFTEIRNILLYVGVVPVVIPFPFGVEMKSASMKVGGKMLLMVLMHEMTVDEFFISLFSEVVNILDGKKLYTRKNSTQETEIRAYDMLVGNDRYRDFVSEGKFDEKNIITFASSLKTDPRIIVSRLQRDCVVSANNTCLNSLKHPCNVRTELLSLPSFPLLYPEPSV